MGEHRADIFAEFGGNIELPPEVMRRLSGLHPRHGKAPWETTEQWQARRAEAEAEWVAFLEQHLGEGYEELS